MASAVIIEDEYLVSQSLVATIKEVDPQMEIKAVLRSVAEGVNYLPNNKPDLIFSDVQLSDGLSFSIFDALNISTPVIFITGYDKFMVDAFEHNGINFLLKPVTKDEVSKAIKKYRRFEDHFSPVNTSFERLLKQLTPAKRSRIIVKKGLGHYSLLLDDVVLFFTENKIVYALDRYCKKYLVDKNLGDLQADLDARKFFRVNRQFILNINYIQGFKAYDKVKLEIELTLHEVNFLIVVSQEMAADFKKWMAEA